jgi:ketosteroid isomerase-like protein
MSGVERADVQRWVDAYERAWRSPGTDQLDDLFTVDATYLVSPWAQIIEGRPAIARFWEAGRDGPDEPFTMSSEIVAVDAEARTAVVRLAVDYHAEDRRRWRDLWIIRFAADGRSTAFEEWPFAPDHDDGQANVT